MKDNHSEILGNFRYLSAIAMAGSLSSAARNLRVTQPALSIAMKQMEQAVGVKLIDRHTYGVRLTDEGNFLLAELRKISLHLEEMRNKLTRLSKEHDEIRIGTKPVFLPTLWPGYFSIISSKFPDITISLTVHSVNAELERQLDGAHIDAALIPLDAGKRRFLDYKDFDESFGLYRCFGVRSVPRRIYGLEGALLSKDITMDDFVKLTEKSSLKLILLPDYASVRSLVDLGQGYGLLSSSFANTPRLEDATHEFAELSPIIRKMGFTIGFRTVETIHDRHSKVVKLVKALCRGVS